jgi:hypothetical protein
MKLIQRAFSSLTSAWKAMFRSFTNLRQEYLVEQYLRSGAVFGDAVSKLYTGGCVDLQAARRHWAHYERAYAELGFRTIAPGEFVEYGGFGKSIEHQLRVTRNPDEQPVLHAELIQHFNQDDYASLLEFGGQSSDAPHCGLSSTDATGDADAETCNLPDCRIRNERSKQEAGRLWHF